MVIENMTADRDTSDTGDCNNADASNHVHEGKQKYKAFICSLKLLYGLKEKDLANLEGRDFSSLTVMDHVTIHNAKMKALKIDPIRFTQ